MFFHCSRYIDLNLEAAGLVANERQNLNVDETYKTQVDNIYAAGDVIGFPSLASTSMDQGRVAVAHMFGLHDIERIAAEFPFGIYTNSQDVYFRLKEFVSTTFKVIEYS